MTEAITHRAEQRKERQNRERREEDWKSKQGEEEGKHAPKL
jgi:hypothetical protein